MDQALHSIKTGQCDAAVVGGSNLCLKPQTALQFMKLGMLSPEGMCKSFDAEGRCLFEPTRTIKAQMTFLSLFMGSKFSAGQYIVGYAVGNLFYGDASSEV